MDAVIRAGALYLILFLVFRISGTRSFAQVTPFDFILILVISETTQNAILGNDSSITYAAIAIITLVTIDVLVSVVQDRFPGLIPWLDDMPVLLVDHGTPVKSAMRRNRLTEEDILQAARLTQGLARLADVKYAILERTGEISIIPASDES